MKERGRWNKYWSINIEKSSGSFGEILATQLKTILDISWVPIYQPPQFIQPKEYTSPQLTFHFPSLSPSYRTPCSSTARRCWGRRLRKLFPPVGDFIKQCSDRIMNTWADVKFGHTSWNSWGNKNELLTEKSASFHDQYHRWTYSWHIITN